VTDITEQSIWKGASTAAVSCSTFLAARRRLVARCITVGALVTNTLGMAISFRNPDPGA
jgi:hypothetical protein